MNNLERGIEAENLVVSQLSPYINESIEQNHSWGVDIVIRNPRKILNIEVKSAKRLIKSGKQGLRQGKFQFTPNNLDRPDFFAFVIYDFNSKAKTVWVRGEVIRRHFKNRKIGKSKFALGIPTLLTKISKIDFSEVIKYGY